VPKLQPEHVRKVYLEAFRGGREKDSPLGLLCMVLVSMACIAGGVMGVACIFPSNHITSEARPLMIITAVCWVLSFFLGMFFGQAQGYNDQSSNDDAGISNNAQLGCFLAIVQFAVGGLYNGLNGLWRWVSGAEEREVTVPVAVITLLCQRPEERHTVSFIGSTLRKSKVVVNPKSLRVALNVLVAKKLVDGDQQIGYCCTLKQVDRFLEEPEPEVT
jgi:hypothetical protein